jgi:16S rRNA (adenine1518-N6/adenine1519-N6)-dimethyltransferase
MRRKGQNFLIDPQILSRIADFARLDASDRVLEIGAGTGNLTEALSRRAGWVYAVEVDRDLATGLNGRFPNVEVIEGDAQKIELPDYNKIVSNLPYQISSKMTYRLLRRPFDLAVLMYQKEFAKRLIAKPGTDDYGRLAMSIGLYARAEILEYVPRTAFRPNPRVASAIVRLNPLPERLDANHYELMRFVSDLFNHRRKKLAAALTAIGVSTEKLSGLDGSILDKRAERLSSEEAAMLFDKLCH